jgi:hypothetical protein
VGLHVPGPEAGVMIKPHLPLPVMFYGVLVVSWCGRDFYHSLPLVCCVSSLSSRKDASVHFKMFNNI